MFGEKRISFGPQWTERVSESRKLATGFGMFVHKISQHTKYLKILSEIKLREGHQLITALLFLTL